MLLPATRKVWIAQAWSKAASAKGSTSQRSVGGTRPKTTAGGRPLGELICSRRVYREGAQFTVSGMSRLWTVPPLVAVTVIV